MFLGWKGDGVHASRTLEPVYLNARADECAAMAKDRGVRIVWHRGDVYTVTGYYLAAHEGERVLCYVLRGPSRPDGAQRRTNNGAPYAAPNNK